MHPELLSLAGLALLLGLRHGLDVDHIATIDGLTRQQQARTGRGSGRCGLWFSAGHGLSLAFLALALAGVGARLAPPDWLQVTGPAIAIVALLAIGAVNLREAWHGGTDGAVGPITLRGWLVRRYAGRLTHTGPLAALGLGAVFAVSFDAVGIAAFFAVTALDHGSAWVALGLGLAFAFGMMSVDGLSGLGSAWLLGRSHRAHRWAPRITGAMLGFGCVATAVVLLIAEVLPGQGESEAGALVMSAAVWVLVPLSWAFTAGLAWVRRPAQARSFEGGGADA